MIQTTETNLRLLRILRRARGRRNTGRGDYCAYCAEFLKGSLQSYIYLYRCVHTQYPTPLPLETMRNMRNKPAAEGAGNV